MLKRLSQVLNLGLETWRWAALTGNYLRPNQPFKLTAFIFNTPKPPHGLQGIPRDSETDISSHACPQTVLVFELSLSPRVTK